MLATLNKSIDSEDIDYKVNVYDNGAKMRGTHTAKPPIKITQKLLQFVIKNTS